MLRKWLALRHWSHVIRGTYRLLRSSNVPVREKLLFLIPVLVYGVAPDVLPFVPVDDVALAMLAAWWFVRRAERKHPDA